MSYRGDTFSVAEGTEHENTTTEGSIAQRLFAAGELLPGKSYEYECAVVVNDSNGADTCTPRVRFGTSATVTSNTAVWTGSAVDVADADVALITGRIHVDSATRYVLTVRGSNTDAVATLSPTDTAVVFTAVAQTAYYLDITLDWSAAHADNEAAAMSWKIWEIT